MIKKINIILIIFLFININKSEFTITSLNGYQNNSIVTLLPTGTGPTDPNSRFCKVNFQYDAIDTTSTGIPYYNVSLQMGSSAIRLNSRLLVQNNFTFSPSSSIHVLTSFYTSTNPTPTSIFVTFNCLYSYQALSFGDYLSTTEQLKYDPFLNSYSGYVYFVSTLSITPPLTIESSSSISKRSQIVYAYSKSNENTYQHYYRVSFMGIISSDSSNWEMTYYLHTIINILNFNPPLNENVNKIITNISPIKYGIQMNSYFSYPQIISTINVSSGSSIYFPRVAFSTSDGSFDYEIPIPISGTTSTSNSITYMINSRSRVESLNSYNLYLPTPTTIYNSQWDNTGFSYFLRSNSQIKSYYKPNIYATGKNVTISSLMGLVSSNKLAEHLGKFKLNGLNNFDSILTFPFGYSGGNLSLWSIDIPILKYQHSKVNYDILLDNGNTVSLEYPKDQNDIGNGIFEVKNIIVIAMNEINSYTFKIDYLSSHGISNIKIMLLPNQDCIRHYTFSQMIITSGDIYDGQVEFYFENFDTLDNLNYESFNLYVYDMAGSEIHLVDTTYFLDNVTKSIRLFEIPSFKRIGLTPSNISTTIWEYNGQVSVVNPSVNKLSVFIDNLNAPFILTINPQLNPIKYYGVYTNNQNYVFSNIRIPSGIIGDGLPFSYTLSTSKSNIIYSSDGNLIEFTTVSNSFDLKGPIINEIIKFNNGINFGYNLTIEDEINGFEYGYIVIMGNIDGSMYNFSLSSSTWKSESSTKYSAKFDITVSRECLFTQQYFIYQLYLVDSQGINSTFFNPTYNDYYQHTHPWSEAPNINSIEYIQVICPINTITYQDPSIKNLTVSKSNIDVFSDDRSVLFNLYIDGDVLEQQLPIIYLTTATNQILQFKTSLVSKGHYNVEVILPFGFGYPIGISVNVFNIIGKNASFVGYSSLSLLIKNISAGFIPVHQLYGPPTIYSDTSSTSSSDLSSSDSLCNIDCGNSNQGKCENDKCICNPPWYGDNCSQKVIIFPRPDKNETDPTSVIVINPTNETNYESISAIINILEIREIEIGGSEFKRFKLSNWTLVNSNNSNQYIYNTRIQTSNNQFTSIKVVIEWYQNETNIIFASYPIKLKPSSIKYTIELDQYPFQNNLNTLQLVLATQISSVNNTKLCSVKQFESDNNNSIQSQDYMKLSVGSLSLEGRFIKRALVDNIPTLISNKQLSNTVNNGYQLIAILIPRYFNSIVIDPDFGVLIDTNSKGSDICNQDSKLSKTKIAGIIIGVIGFSIVIASSIIYILYRKKQNAVLQNKIKNIQLNEK